MEINHLLIILLVTCAFVTSDSEESLSAEEYDYHQLSRESDGSSKESKKSNKKSSEEEHESSEELSKEKGESSEESSEEKNVDPKDNMKCVDYVKVKDVESCLSKRCEAGCAAANMKIAKGAQTVLKSCGWGCANQISTFKAAQAAFQHTAGELLLGTAVDKCWDGCIEMFRESGQRSCIAGCETMRKIQRDQLRSNAANEKKGVEKEEGTKLKSDETEKESENLNVNNIQTKEENKGEDPGHLRTYILWHPMDQQHAYQAFNVMFNIAQKMFEDLDDMDSFDNEKETPRGWRDDRRQFRIPHYQPNVAALRSDDGEASEIYDKVVDSLNNIKDKIKETVSEPVFKENMFYLLMTICCFLLLVALYDNCTEENGAESEEDHFLLMPDKAAAAKLPSYEDCIKADKVLAVQLQDEYATKETSDIEKKDLQMIVVIDDEGLEKK